MASDMHNYLDESRKCGMAGYKIVKADKSNEGPLLRYLKNDITRHAFAFYDLVQEPENTTIFIATSDDGAVSGYLLIYKATRYLSIILDCPIDAAEELLRAAPREKGILFVPRNLLSVAIANINSTGIFTEDQMSLTREKANLYPSEMARRLSVDDSKAVAELYSSNDVGGSRDTDIKATTRRIERSPFFGLEVEGRLVAVAGTLAVMPEVSVIGGVFTHPFFRGKGFAKVVTSAVARQLFGISNLITLYVRSDNQTAISAYRRLGFEKTWVRFWVDMGTGLHP
jgi:ribosomal protein S18 acetylase RimI-like enzyme